MYQSSPPRASFRYGGGSGEREGGSREGRREGGEGVGVLLECMCG